jgi:hypothetical protein
MKKFFLIVFAAVFMAIPLFSFGQTETINANNEPEKKISYSFINEYGTFLGGTFGFTGVFVNGIKFNKTQDMIGIGIGYEYDSESEQSIPIFFNYRHYFPGKRALKPLVNIGAGIRISFWEKFISHNSGGGWSGWYETQIYPGLYLTMAAGFRVKAFSFTSGFFMKSCGVDNFFGGVEVKVGFTF